MSKKLEIVNEKSNLVLKIGNRVPYSGLICAILAGASFTAGKLLIKEADTIHPTVSYSLKKS